MQSRPLASTVLYLFGFGLLAGLALWLITGDIDQPWFQLRVQGGWRGFAVGLVGAVAAIGLAWRINQPNR